MSNINTNFLTYQNHKTGKEESEKLSMPKSFTLRQGIYTQSSNDQAKTRIEKLATELPKKKNRLKVGNIHG